jgi:hypothetical protein
MALGDSMASGPSSAQEVQESMAASVPAIAQDVATVASSTWGFRRLSYQVAHECGLPETKMPTSERHAERRESPARLASAKIS